MTVVEIDIPGGVGFCNAVRRSLIANVPTWAPYEIEVRVNTSCQTDEFLAHRIGLIPFRRVGNGNEMTLRHEGPGAALASDCTGPAFEAVHGGVEIMRLGPDQALDLTIRFNEGTASKHARYAAVAAVGMERSKATGVSTIRFEPIDPQRRTRDVLGAALTALEERVDKALLQLANQPEVAPKSMC